PRHSRPGGAAHHQSRYPGRRLRPGLRAQSRAPDAHQGGAVELVRLRRHQWKPDLPQARLTAREVMSGPESPTSPTDRPSLLRPVSADSSALLALHAAFPDRYPALFESAAAGNASTRYDILFAYPQAQLCLRNGATRSTPPGLTSNGIATQR